MKTQHKIGDTKVVSKFAFFPIIIDSEVRWLSYVHIHKTYTNLGWVNDYFIDLKFNF